MSLTDRALWVIERNLGAPLSLAGLADACAVTRFHLAHAFADVTGRSVMEYVRLRRLTESAKLLADGADNILQVALASGYGSHEAFTRAFRAHFKVTPVRYRRDGPPDPCALVEPLAIEVRHESEFPAARTVAAPAFQVLGLVATHGFGDVTRIPAQWRAFGPQIEAIPERVGAAPLGLMLDIDDDGRFSYACAVEVAGADRPPRGLHRLRVPAGTYAVFPHRGHVSELNRTYAAIFDRWFPARGERLGPAPVLERHDPRFDVRTGRGGLEIWAPLAR
ncbi:MAG TPA: GyrI-like domain-containing protein [Caulobacteraceae bacterium]|nr:GyrI-like domain-containing protein [Caulobacteraceae bacterium]